MNLARRDKLIATLVASFLLASLETVASQTN